MERVIFRGGGGQRNGGREWELRLRIFVNNGESGTGRAKDPRVVVRRAHLGERKRTEEKINAECEEMSFCSVLGLFPKQEPDLLFSRNRYEKSTLTYRKRLSFPL